MFFIDLSSVLSGAYYSYSTHVPYLGRCVWFRLSFCLVFLLSESPLSLSLSLSLYLSLSPIFLSPSHVPSYNVQTYPPIFVLSLYRFPSISVVYFPLHVPVVSVSRLSFGPTQLATSLSSLLFLPSCTFLLKATLVSRAGAVSTFWACGHHLQTRAR